MCPSQSANGDLGAIKSSAADPKSRTTTGLLALNNFRLAANNLLGNDRELQSRGG